MEHLFKRTEDTLKTVTLALAFVSIFQTGAVHAQKTLLNVSYDPTRELYKEFNPAFIKYWQAKTGESVSFKQAHGGSGAQARAMQAEISGQYGG